ncbi:MAG: ribonuclease P protein component [Gammaproteobacteria bacterium]|nr:ribonuclease P protein component [Gammaproteobacteria bacterium]
MTSERLCFPREARLLKASEFRTVFRAGRRARVGLLHARFRLNGKERARLGLAVSLKATRKAVVRNRVRRQLRESFRVNQHRLVGLDVVVSLSRPAAGGSIDLSPRLPDLWSEIVRAAEAEGKWKD